MKRRTLLWLALLGAGSSMLTFSSQAMAATIPATRSYRRGINIAGGEYGDYGSAYGSENNIVSASNALSYTRPGVYGTDYMYPTAGDISYFQWRLGDRAIGRLNVRIERLTTAPGSALRSTEVTRITNVLNAAQADGFGIILAPWNFGAVWIRNTTDNKTYRRAIGSTQFTHAQYADFWKRVVLQWGNHPAVVGVDLMVEPVNIPNGGAGWQRATQTAVTAIRTINTNIWIWVPTYGYGLNEVYTHHPNGPWITDSTGRFGYKGHHYSYNSDGFESDYPKALAAAKADGFTKGTNYDELHTRELYHLSRFATWLNGHHAYIGEYGIPHAEHPQTVGAAQWKVYGERMLDEYDKYRWNASAWTGGRVCDPTENFTVYYPSWGWNNTVDAPTSIATIIEAHPSTPA